MTNSVGTPETITIVSFPISGLPSSKWSFTKRLPMFLVGKGNARGFRQWKAANRWLKKGARAIYMRIPKGDMYGE